MKDMDSVSDFSVSYIFYIVNSFGSFEVDYFVFVLELVIKELYYWFVKGSIFFS